MTPQDYVKALKQSYNLIFVIFHIIVILMSNLMNQANHRIVLTEKKKEEAEKQKTFLLSFSHELRNLINSLTGNIKLASLDHHISGRVKELLKNAEMCTELLLYLVNNILDTGKAEVGDLEVDPKPTKIYDSFERIWGVCSELIRRKDLRGTMKIENDLPRTILADPYRLTQIFINIVGNSIKFTDRGSIKINIQWIKDTQEVTEQCFKPYPFNDEDDQDEGLFEKDQDFSVFKGNYLVLDTYNRKVLAEEVQPSSDTSQGILKVAITDTGCGMEKEATKKLFNRFTQVTSDASKRKLGTGLGLFIIKELCKKMNGDIKVFSKEGKGSCFVFCIPITPVKEEQQELMSAAYLKGVAETNRMKAMIVDSSLFNHLVLKTLFKKLGIEVIAEIINGVEAVEKYYMLTRAGNRPRIVLMERDMPVMDGREASKKIRDFELREGLGSCFLGLMSQDCDEIESKQCLDIRGQIRADSCLRQPVISEDLVTALASYFRDQRNS